ncbi:alpha-galactosidase [Luteolibacter arcticus]|uniref:Alpha-galactosidase n=1 Tax=Luteolibacter arcticus TaxID=1581411 RepID=A0ABT3GNC6_9BACT|nr:alpha-galactosidase [Luteolibacter arcticus]MCW1925019.1 alpha-galactosidase [Luteolibacter arcticus]
MPIRPTLITTIFSALLMPVTALQPFPGKAPGLSLAENKETLWTLRNEVISASWSLHNGELRPSEVSDQLNGKTFPQKNRELFRLAVAKDVVAAREEPQTWMGLTWDETHILAQTSTNGNGWRTIARLPRQRWEGSPTLLRVGKMDKKGGATDYVDAGVIGAPRFDRLAVLGDKGPLFTEDFDSASLAGWRQIAPQRTGASLAVTEGWLTLQAPANCAAFLERSLPEDTRQVRCQIDRTNDEAQSWGPGLALVWPDGKAIVVNIRKDGGCSVTADGNEQVIGSPFQPVPDYNLVASRLKVFEGPKLVKLPAEAKNPRAATQQPGKAIVAKLRDETTGLAVLWRAILRDGSNYIREEITLISPKGPVVLSGVQLIDRQMPEAMTLGDVPGSPVISGNLFSAAEIPVFSSETDSQGFTSGFPCDYRLDGAGTVKFSTVTGVVPEGQLRRGFQYYLERERARPAKQYLHFNGWYDTGTNVSETNLLAVIKAYKRELGDQRGVTLDGFVIDDGWDDANNTFWDWKKSALPNGLDRVRTAAEGAKSRLGIWISPLGGYGEAAMRIANARKQGIVDGDALDLSEPRYYSWYRNKCLDLMKNDRVGYFKWDKAGDGVNPHFMSLLKIAEELHTADPSLFLNVTVGTWPSPFWLNHIDCTWHGGADVGWIGRGDKREQWLTYRDSSAYQHAKRGPLYPINSLMLHGIVLGHHYQGKTVAEAGNNLRNECRSFFATGTCMQEIYLSPDLMDAAAWDDLAETAKWARKQAAILVDSHMIGGDPNKLEPYGWASWTPGGAIVALRNPDDQPRTITLDAQAIFELPEYASTRYALKSAYKEQRVRALNLEAREPIKVELQPFEVLVFDSGE